jgi:hypothetical protein
MSKTDERVAKIRAKVEDFYNNHSHLVDLESKLIPDSRQHIIAIGTSILCTKWEVGPPGGSFVQAMVNNNLMESFSRADSINAGAIRFYCSLIYNTVYIP